MSARYAKQVVTLMALGLITSACASHPPPRDPSGCALNELPLASFIEEVNRCGSRPVAVAAAAFDNPSLGGALCICSSTNVSFALRWLGIEAVEDGRIPIAQAEQRASQQKSRK
jgi:hypothetical protein